MSDDAASPTYTGPIVGNRVRAAIVVGKEVIVSADSAVEKFRIQGSTAP